MANRARPFFLLTLLVIGLLNAAVFAWGFGRIAHTVEYKDFFSSYTPSIPGPHPWGIVPLSNDRFTVVDQLADSIVVYKVDAQNHITRVSEAKASYAPPPTSTGTTSQHSQPTAAPTVVTTTPVVTAAPVVTATIGPTPTTAPAQQ